MSRKRKSRSPSGGQALFERAQRELAKGDAKAALKDALRCYREQASPAHRQLLEKAYVGRVKQLHQLKLPAEARAVLARLIDLEPTMPEIREAIPHLQILVGDSGVDANAVFETNPELLVGQVDRAVLDSREAVPDYGDARLNIGRVREALVFVERGDDQAAAKVLREIPRSSPLCDWKLFVRGLSAFYGSDRDRTRENWRRLDPQRPAYRIAQTLLVAAGEPRGEDAPIDVSGPLKRLELKLQESATADLLQQIALHWRERDLSSFFNAFRRLRLRHAKTDGALLERIVEFVWKRAVREGDSYMLDKLVQIGPAPADDPHWYRARAALAEHPEQSSSAPVESNWTAYADELASLPALREEDRPIASGLAYSHLAQRFVEYGEACEPPPFVDEPTEQETEESREFYVQAIAFFEESLRRCPRLIEAYWGLSMLHERMESPEKGAAVLKNLVRQDPENYDARMWLATFYLAQDDPSQAEPHAEAAACIKPRDPRTLTMRWNQRILMIRSLTKNRQFEAARMELEAASKLPAPDVEPYALDTLRAAIEFKAKNAETAQRHLDTALSKIDEPTAIWIQMSCTAARFSLPREIKKDFDDRFKKAIKKKPTSQTAGCLAAFLATLHAARINYTGRATQERLVIAYLKRAKRVPWNERDLVRVCEWLAVLPKEAALRKRTITMGVKKFPDNVTLHFLAGQLEMEAGPIVCDIDKAERHMNRVLELASPSISPIEKKMTEMAQRVLGILHEMKERMAFSFASPFSGADDDHEDEEGFFMPPFFDDDEEECDCEDCRRRRELFSSPENIDSKTLLDELKRTMPRPLVQQLERAAEQSGVDLAEMLGEMMETQTQGEATKPNQQQGGPRRRDRRKRQRARQ